MCLSYVTRQQLRRQKNSVSCHFIVRHFHVRHSELGKNIIIRLEKVVESKWLPIDFS